MAGFERVEVCAKDEIDSEMNKTEKILRAENENIVF